MVKGTVKNKNNEPLEQVKVELKDRNFDTKIMCETDANGYFEFKEQGGVYPFLTAVKEYNENYLEFWGLHVDLSKDITFDIKIGKNEIYGTNVMCVNGAPYPLFVFFRPMDLKKCLKGCSDITPAIAKESISVRVDGRETEIFSLGVCAQR